MEQLMIKSADYILKDIDKEGTVIFIANAFGNQDAGGDISLKGSYSKTLRENFGRVRYLFNHDITRKIGEPLEGWETDQGLVIKAVLNLNKDDGRNVYEDYRMAAEYGKNVEHSVGVVAMKHKGVNPRYISEWKLVETSYIPLWGMNEATPMLAIKSSDTSFIEYCIKNGNHTDCYLKKYESLVEPSQTLESADDELKQFYNKLKF